MGFYKDKVKPFIIKRTLHSFYFLSVSFGLIPFLFNFKKLEVRPNKLVILVIKIIWLAIVVLLCPKLIKDFIEANVETIKPRLLYSIINEFGSLLFLKFIIILTFVYRKKIMLFINTILKFHKIYFLQINYYKVQKIFVARSLFVNIALFVFFIFNYVHALLYSPDYNLLLYLFKIMVPIQVMRLTTAWIYGAVLIMKFYYENLNQMLDREIKKINKIFYKQDFKVLAKYQTCCDLSDFLDKLCLFHGDLADMADMLNKIFNLPAIFIFGIAIFTIISKFFFLYISAARSIVYKAQANNSQLIIDCLWIYMYSVEIYVLASICNAIKKEARRTGQILHQLNMDEVDNRLKNSIECFSLQMLQRRIEFTICGLFVLDHTVLYSIIAAGTGYLIILIQFELADNHIDA